MKRALFIALLAAWPLPVRAQTADAQAQAEAALHSGFPQAAIAPLKDAIREGRGNTANLSLLLARLQLAAGRPEDALATLDSSGRSNVAEWKLLRAAALSAQGGMDAAAALLEPLVPSEPEAALMLARIRMEQGDPGRARQILEQASPEAAKNPQHARLLLDLVLSSGDADAAENFVRELESQPTLPKPELDAARGRIYLARKQSAEAATAFSSALTDAKASPQVRDNARLGLARAAVMAGDRKKGRDILREALAAGATPAALRQMMEEWIALEKSLGTDPAGDLRLWAAKKDEPRGVEATLQLARLDLDTRGTEAALASLQELAGKADVGPEEKRRAQLLIASARIAAGQHAEALALLDSLDGGDQYTVAMLRGRALAAADSNRQAHAAFLKALESAGTPEEKYAAGVNCYLTALAASDLPLAKSALKALRETAPDHPRLLEWSFLLAAAEAREGEIDDLSVLARRAPSTDYAFQAKLALAEWRLARGEGEASERILKTAEPEASTAPRAAALAAAEIFAADNSGSKPRGELVVACGNFLAKYPDAPEAPDIAFKLAELHARGGDHAAAETILAGLAEKLPDAESASLAKFLAAQAASRSMSDAATDRALVWFNELAQGQSSLRHRARFEQASLLLRQRKFADALALQDSILASDPPPEVRHAARMERGDILFALGAADPAKLDEAAAAYELVASDKTAPPDWRDQATCKYAAALARRGKTEKALALYRLILDRPPAEGSDQFWFLKAGLEAGHLLEEQKDWPAAVAIYDRMASASGVQSKDLEQRARRLRLEHFIWEN